MAPLQLWSRMVICVFAVLLASCSVSTVDSNQSEMDEVEPGSEQSTAYQYGRTFLSPAAMTVYDRLCAMADAFDTDSIVQLPSAVDRQEADRILAYFWSDNPRYYWLLPYWEQDNMGNLFLGLRCAEGMSPLLARSQYGEMEEHAKVLLANLNGDDFEKAVQLHDRLAIHTEYNPHSRQAEAQTVYGSLVSRSAICDGYARAYQYLLGELGIPCIYITGTTARGLTHAWNAVQLDGDWYYVDVTWDDRGHVRHDYCLVTLEEMTLEHRWDASQYPRLPESGGKEQNYYYRYGYLIDEKAASNAKQPIAELFTRQLLNGAQRTADGTTFLEARIDGPAGHYYMAKEQYIQSLLEIVEEIMDTLPEDFPATVDFDSPVTCGYNDEMQVLYLFIRFYP